MLLGEFHHPSRERRPRTLLHSIFSVARMPQKHLQNGCRYSSESCFNCSFKVHFDCNFKALVLVARRKTYSYFNYSFKVYFNSSFKACLKFTSKLHLDVVVKKLSSSQHPASVLVSIAASRPDWQNPFSPRGFPVENSDATVRSMADVWLLPASLGRGLLE